MEKCVWKAKVYNGKADEYERRHKEIWPEMIEVLKSAGIKNYSIWNIGNDLFGYYECESIEYASYIKANSEIFKKWNEYMKDILIMEKDPVTGVQALPKQVFYLE